MKKVISCIILAMALFCCKSKKVSLSGSEKVSTNDFLESFELVKTPYQVSDSVFEKEDNDSSLISYRIFTQFVKDTVITKHYPRGTKPDLYPIARIRTDNKENYLFCKSVTDEKELVYLLYFDKSNKFKASKVLFAYNKIPSYHSLAAIDNKLTLTIMQQHKSSEGELLYKKDAYVLSDADRFTLILTESNEPAAKAMSIINPIDTLPHKHKFSGDYVLDKKNFISVRDGRTSTTFLFFVHFEKDGGTCNGELKGEARFNSPVSAVFHGSNDPCTVRFSFSGNKITMKELEGCGNYRDIKCFFEGTYTKKKEEKSRPKNMKKKKR